MILPTLNSRFPGQVDEGLWIEDKYHRDEWYLVLREATLLDYMKQEWAKGRRPNPDPEWLIEERGRLRFYEIVLLGER